MEMICKNYVDSFEGDTNVQYFLTLPACAKQAQLFWHQVVFTTKKTQQYFNTIKCKYKMVTGMDGGLVLPKSYCAYASGTLNMSDPQYNDNKA